MHKIVKDVVFKWKQASLLINKKNLEYVSPYINIILSQLGHNFEPDSN